MFGARSLPCIQESKGLLKIGLIASHIFSPDAAGPFPPLPIFEMPANLYFMFRSSDKHSLARKILFSDCRQHGATQKLDLFPFVTLLRLSLSSSVLRLVRPHLPLLSTPASTLFPGTSVSCEPFWVTSAHFPQQYGVSSQTARRTSKSAFLLKNL